MVSVSPTAAPLRVVLFSGGRGSSALATTLVRTPGVVLTVAINGYDDGAGWVLRGSASGLTTTSATSFNATDFGYPVVAGRKFASVFAR